MDTDIDFIVPMLKFLLLIMDEPYQKKPPSFVVEKNHELKKLIVQYIDLQERLSKQLKTQTIVSPIIYETMTQIENKEEEIEVLCKNIEYEMRKK